MPVLHHNRGLSAWPEVPGRRSQMRSTMRSLGKVKGFALVGLALAFAVGAHAAELATGAVADAGLSDTIVCSVMNVSPKNRQDLRVEIVDNGSSPFGPIDCPQAGPSGGFCFAFFNVNAASAGHVFTSRVTGDNLASIRGGIANVV